MIFNILTDGCEPTMGSRFSACIDLYAAGDIEIPVGSTVMVPLGISINLEELRETCFRGGSFVNMKEDKKDEYFKAFLKSHYIKLLPRSSTCRQDKYGLIIPNGEGVIDLDYPDEIKVMLHNPTRNVSPIEAIQYHGGPLNTPLHIRFLHTIKIKKGDKIAQAMMCEHQSYLFEIESDRERAGGFGSTGE